SFARTLSISSTNILIRLISMAKAEMNKTMDLEPIDFSTMSDSLPDNEVMARFFKNSNKAQPGQKIIYLHGVFDLFNTDHIDLLEKASKYGVKDEDKKNFLIVGVLSSTNG
ncbi:MAG: Ethanolamine-phosphate cytidylyltransferase, partial [Paramarteilia canceri]